MVAWLKHRQWKLCWSHECHDCEEFLRFSDRLWAQSWLKRTMRDRTGSLRSLLARDCPEIWRLNDHRVLEQAADRLVRAHLRVCMHSPAIHTVTVTRRDAEPAPAFPLDARSARVAGAPAPETEHPLFPAQADLAAIAELQKEAARLGLPFCEECAKQQIRQRSPAGL